MSEVCFVSDFPIIQVKKRKNLQLSNLTWTSAIVWQISLICNYRKFPRTKSVHYWYLFYFKWVIIVPVWFSVFTQSSQLQLTCVCLWIWINFSHSVYSAPKMELQIDSTVCTGEWHLLKNCPVLKKKYNGNIAPVHWKTVSSVDLYGWFFLSYYKHAKCFCFPFHVMITCCTESLCMQEHLYFSNSSYHSMYKLWFYFSVFCFRQNGSP